MKNVTISMDEELAQLARVAAAKAGQSLSRYLADAAREKLANDNAEGSAQQRKANLEALERFLAGPKLEISKDGRMPTSEERNARR